MMLYLASNSPRRRYLLALAGWEFQVVSAVVDESPRSGEVPEEYVLRLAVDKTHSVDIRWLSPGIVIAADTTVAERDGHGADMLGKPASSMEAEQMLRRLRGRKHQVYTALALRQLHDDTLITDLCRTAVKMRDYSDAELIEYVATQDPLDKAGAYAIQHPVFQPVETLEGCYANVMGLPLCHLARNLVKLGSPPRVNVPEACQNELGYLCPVHAQILLGEHSK